MAVAEKRRLGRGLDALLGGTLDSTLSGASDTAQVPLEQIEVNPHQPRRDFDPDELDSLKKSLETHGLLQPVVVRPTDHGYQLIAGERRLRAAKEVGWKEIPVRVVDFNDQQVFEAALVENLQRADLNAIEKAQGFQEYLTRYGMTHDQLAKKVQLDRSTITNLIRLLELPPDVQDAVRLGQISNGHARALLALDDPTRQSAVCKEIITKGLSVRAVEALGKAPGGPTKGNAPAAPQPSKTAHLQGIEDDLRQVLSTRVEIRLKTDDHGQFVIDFQSNDDFERLLAILRSEPARR